MPRPPRYPGERAIRVNWTAYKSDLDRIKRILKQNPMPKSELMRLGVAALEKLNPAQRLEIARELNESEKNPLTGQDVVKYKTPTTHETHSGETIHEEAARYERDGKKRKRGPSGGS